MPVTWVLLALCSVVFILQVIQSGTIFAGAASGAQVGQDGGLFGPAVAEGEWWRLFTHATLHAGIIHFAFNMFILWWVGRLLEPRLGAGRYLGVFLVSVLGGGALGLLLDPLVLGVGISGGIFGLMACELILEWRRSGNVLASPVAGLFGLNLVLTFMIPGVSVGGHLGGAIGGAVCGGLVAWGDARRIDGRIITAALGALVVFALALGVALA